MVDALVSLACSLPPRNIRSEVTHLEYLFWKRGRLRRVSQLLIWIIYLGKLSGFHLVSFPFLLAGGGGHMSA